MKETIKAVLENYKDANLESEAAREKIAEEIEKALKKKIMFISRKLTWEKDNG